ncbi:unnamed protein product, partial [Prunus brigantina]
MPLHLFQLHFFPLQSPSCRPRKASYLKWQHQCPILEWVHHLPAIAFRLQAHTNMCSSCQAICILHALNSSQAF